MTRIVLQKHCEVLGIDPDLEEKNTYYVRVLLSKDTEEFSPEIPLKLKGTPQEIAKILSFLGEQFNQGNTLENKLDDLSIAPLSFQMSEGLIIGKDVHGHEVISGSLAEEIDVAKITAFSQKFFSKTSD